MKYHFILLSIFVTGCSTKPWVDPIDWATIGEGCVNRSISESMVYANLAGVSVGATDIRIGRVPDRGSTTRMMVHFRRGMEPTGLWFEQETEPTYLLAVGDSSRTCTVVLDQTECPHAELAYQELSKKTIPIGYEFDDPIGFAVMHADTYFLSSRDGHGNYIDWTYAGSHHPLQDEIHKHLNALENCAAPAFNAFQRHES